MSQLDASLPATVKSLIERFGTSATFEVSPINAENYSPSTGQVEDVVPETFPAKVTPPQPRRQSLLTAQFIPTTQAEIVGDLVTYLAALNLAFTPQLGMSVTIQGVRYNIIGMNSYSTGDLIAVYELGLSR
jgi:hypothetical protein